jgi:hypothetical protein
MNRIGMHCRLMEKILHCVQNDRDAQCIAMESLIFILHNSHFRSPSGIILLHIPCSKVRMFWSNLNTEK